MLVNGKFEYRILILKDQKKEGGLQDFYLKCDPYRYQRLKI